MRLTDINLKALREYIGTRRVDGIPMTLVKANGSAAKIDSTTGHGVKINGIHKAACAAFNEAVVTVIAAEQPNITGLSTFYVQPAGTTVYYTLVSDGATNSATVVQVLQGTYLGQPGIIPGSREKGTGEIPAPVTPDTYAVIGWVKVVTAGVATFTPGTTAFDAASVTSTFYDGDCIPS